MRVGLCYDLRQEYLREGFTAEQTAEFDAPETIAALEFVLRSRGYQVEKIGHLRNLVLRLEAGKRWDFVFNIAEGLAGPGREAQIPCLLEGYGIPCVFSDPMVLALALDKGMTKRILRDARLPTADFRVIRSPTDFSKQDLPYPVFVKPLTEGTGKGISAQSFQNNFEGLEQKCLELWQQFGQPVLVERYLPGREFTVGLLGQGSATEVIAVMEVEFLPTAEAHGYSFENKEHYENRVRYHLVEDPEAIAAAEIARQAWQILGCRDGGRIDLRSDEHGNPQFLEVNPLAGLHPERSDLVILAKLAGWNYAELIGRILDAFVADLPNRQALGWNLKSRRRRSRNHRSRRAS